ncbi:hypothetical protein Tco_1405838 [Tanacetum coccineum]
MLATGRYAIDRSRYEGKEIAKPITPPSESASEEDSDPEQAHKDKDMQKNCLSLQSTSRNSTILNQLKLRTSSTLKNKECGYYSKEQSDWLARHREEIYDKCGSTFTVTWQRFWRYAKMLSNVMMRRELTECKSILAETSRTLGESNSIRDSCLVALQNKQTGFERFKAFNDHTVDYDKLERREDAGLRLANTGTITKRARTFRVILFSIHNDEWKSFQCHYQTAPRIHKDGDGDASFQLKSDSLPHAHAQTTKTFYKHQDSKIMKAQELKTKTSAQTLIYKIFLQRYQVYQGRLLASFQDDAKYEHVGQDTRSQGGKDDQDGRIKI